MRNLIYKLIYITIKILGDDSMLALLLANRVILGTAGFTFDQVPEVMKPQVYAILKDNGIEFLAGDYTPPTDEE